MLTPHASDLHRAAELQRRALQPREWGRSLEGTAPALEAAASEVAATPPAPADRTVHAARRRSGREHAR